MSKRSRTQSKYEEANVSSFVDATIDFTSNVTVKSLPSTAVPASALLLGTAENLAKEEFVAALPYTDKELIKRIIADGQASKVRGSTIFEGANSYRVSVGVIPTEASRHNCALRPDVVTSLAASAVGGEAKDNAITIFCAAFASDATTDRTSIELAYASAIAKSTISFSAKKSHALKAYMPTRTAIDLYFIGNGAAEVTPEQHAALLDSVQLCMRIVDAPPNLLDTTTYPEIVQGYGKRFGFDVEVISGEDLREQGYGGIYGVGKAAEFPPALVVMRYKCEGAKQNVAMVGKGIVYDTGGLSLKVGGSMCSMKCDMGGSAGVFTGFLTAVRLKAQVNLTCILCLADNAVGPRSQRNDDIVLMKSGMTVEINNTDAEGRLVLGDGVHYASTLNPQPDLIIDMATLTGAQGIATGKKHGAIFTDSEQWENCFVHAGRTSGDLVFPVLFCPEFSTPEFSSKVADSRNSVRARNNAQVSCAGQFIHNNLATTFKNAHVHIDMAGPAFTDEKSTGYGPTLLAQMFCHHVYKPGKC